MKPSRCRVCGVEEWRHVCASNKRSSKRNDASNGGVGDRSDRSDRKQRWSREAYNAYQREYMRVRRAFQRIKSLLKVSGGGLGN